MNNAAGILVHQYGSNVFHTNADPILEYLSQFTAWRRVRDAKDTSLKLPDLP